MRAPIWYGHLVTILLASFVVGFITTSSCAKAPPTLSPAATVAWNSHQVQKDLDLIRDIAQDGNAQNPPVFTTDTTRKITQWHASAITVLHAAGAGWPTVITTSLDETLKNIPVAERDRLAPYVALAKAILAQVVPQ